jgi:hypothetical protein
MRVDDVALDDIGEVNPMPKRERLYLSAVLLVVVAGTARADYEVVKSAHGSLVLSGYAIGRYTYQQGEDLPDQPAARSNFSCRSASLIFAGDVFKYAGYFIYFDLACSPALMDAYGTLKIIPRTEIRAGQFLVPFSRESYTSTSKLLLIDRSLASTNIAPPLGRDAGVQVKYKINPAGKSYWGALAVAVVNGSGPNRADENNSKDVAFRLAGNPLPWEKAKGFVVEAYYYLGKPAFYNPANPLDRWGTADGRRYGACLALERDRVTFQAEALRRKTTYERPYGATYEESEGGYYVQASYKEPLPLPWLQIVEPCGRWESYDADLQTDGDALQAVTGGLNLHFDPGHHAKLMANYQHFIEEAEKIDNDKISAQFQVKF